MNKIMRPIRSFVRRGGRLTTGQAKALAEHNGSLISLEDLSKIHTIFPKEQPLILEIGFGMGHSLLTQALQNPQQNFLGIEVHQPGVGALLSGIAKEELTNLCIFPDDIMLALEKFPDEIFSGVQIFFPDPWPKKRHHKRRLIQEKFLATLLPKIKSGGYLHCATDWEHYAMHMKEVIEKMLELESVEFISRPATRPVTKFERRGLKLGHGIFDLWVIKR